MVKELATLTDLYRYPVKSCGAEKLTHAQLDSYGIQYDRRWMVTDAAGRFLTQRHVPQLATVSVEVNEGGTLAVAHPDCGQLEVADSGSGKTVDAQVWHDRCIANDCGQLAADFFSELLDQPVRLLFSGDAYRREVDRIFVPDNHQAQTAFSDGFPLLLIGSASLEDLNARLDVPVPMNRFRPNLVIQTTEPFAEDQWGKVRVGEIELSVVKACTRCLVTTTDQASGSRMGSEPLTTLATYRRTPEGVIFGQNVIHLNQGRIKVGDAVAFLPTSQ